LDGLGQGNRVYIQGSLMFVLSGFNGDLGNLTDVSFQYGTSLTEPNIIGVPHINPPNAVVPEPTTMIAGIGALGLLLLGAGVHSKRSVLRLGK
jgi:hypothetical protein